VARAREIHQDVTHQLSGDGEEVSAVLPAHLGSINEPQVGFMDQRRGLQCVIRSLSSHVPLG
jgi:hypothetical protein